jgi:aspartate kinase
MKMKVCKFGGTSVASADQIKKVAQIVIADPSRKIIVVSAPGKRFSTDDKVTDLLIHLAEKALKGEDTEIELKEVVNRYEQIAAGLGLSLEIVSVIENDLRERLANDKNDSSLFLDCLKASGEDNNAKLIAAYFSHIGMDAHYMCPK